MAKIGETIYRVRRIDTGEYQCDFNGTSYFMKKDRAELLASTSDYYAGTPKEPVILHEVVEFILVEVSAWPSS